MSTELRRIPIHQSLHRHNLVLGAERELAMSVVLIAFLVGVGGMTALSAVSATIFFIISMFVLRRMAKTDPLMSRIWRRHVNHQSFYCAKGTPWRQKAAFKAAR